MFYAGGFDCGAGLVDAGFDLDDVVSFVEEIRFLRRDCVGWVVVLRMAWGC